MEHKPALYALLKLHAELGGRIKDNAREAVRLRDGMKHVEAVLKLLEPGFNARSIMARRRNNQNQWFRRGTIFRATLETLKAATAPMTAEEISIALLRSKGVAEPSKRQVESMYGAVNSSLLNHAGKSVTVHEGRPRRWSLAG